MSQEATTVAVPEVAYYYPAPFWASREQGWIKSLLLFFDQISILLPDYMHGRHLAADPFLVEPLEEGGLLRVLEPKEWVDQEMTEQLATTVVDLLVEGAFDDLQTSSHFAELSQSRIGYGADVSLSEMLVEELLARGLARPSEDGVSIPLHPVVRTSILVLLAQLARTAGVRHGMNIHPATNNVQAVRDLMEMLSRAPLPSSGHVLALDLEPVSLDLDSVPLDEVLEFRSTRLEAHKSYMRDLRRTVAELAATSNPSDRETLLARRREELADAARELQRATRRAFGKNLASWALGLAGAAWAVSGSDPFGVALSGAGLLTGLVPTVEQTSAYSYLFAVRDEFRFR